MIVIAGGWLSLISDMQMRQQVPDIGRTLDDVGQRREPRATLGQRGK
jgi:hypothetical protein